ncbi:MAG: restriction endonuclease, partial [Chloroflexi bacterium]
FFIQFLLPKYEDIIPNKKGFKYVKARDEIEPEQLNKTDKRNMEALYADVIASITLRVIYELFAADMVEAIHSVVFNGVTNAIDPATGKDIQPCLISVQVDRTKFQELDLERVDKMACLNHLNARMSSNFAAAEPIAPIVVVRDSKLDYSSSMNEAINLLEMDPFEFEHLVTALFNAMGLNATTTQQSNDGGIDVIAIDETPITGGKIAIQVKRYRNPVGVKEVRALYGAMQAENAMKGILVTTSSFGAASYQFAQDYHIALIDGENLLQLLEQHEIGNFVIKNDR